MASHPKTAHARPRRELAAAEDALTAARVELNAANASLRILQRANGAATAHWLAVSPKLTAEMLHREMAAKQQAEKLARVARGEPLETPKPKVIHQTPIDAAFANGRRSGNIDKRTTRPAPRPVTR